MAERPFASTDTKSCLRAKRFRINSIHAGIIDARPRKRRVHIPLSYRPTSVVEKVHGRRLWMPLTDIKIKTAMTSGSGVARPLTLSKHMFLFPPLMTRHESHGVALP